MGNGAVSRESGKLSVRTSIPRTALMALGSALFVVAGGAICAVVLNVLLTETAGMSSLALAVTVLVDSFYLVAGLAAIVFFGFTLLFSLGRLFSFWQPIFEVGPEGILDRASAVSVGFLRWEEVKDVRPGTISGQRFMKVRVKDEQALLQRQNLVKRLLMRLNRRYFTGTIVNVPLNALAIPEEELLAEIKPHLNPPAQRRLDKLIQSVGSAGPKGGTTRGARNSRITSTHSALRIAGSVVRGIAVFVLSIIYYAIIAGLLGLGVAFTWNSLGPGQASELAHPIAGVILLVLGIAWFIFFPRLIKKITGREPINSPYYGGF